MSKAQIIYGDDGAPAFVVMPYASYRALVPDEALSDEELYDRAKAEDDGFAIPQNVVSRLIGKENPLKVFREWRGLKQADLAEKVGVSVGYISQVERGTRMLSRKARASAASVLNVDPEDLD